MLGRAGDVDVAVRKGQDLVLGSHGLAQPGQPSLGRRRRLLHRRVE